MQPMRVNLSRWLSETLDSSGWSQSRLAKELATAMGVKMDRSVVNKMVTGRRSISGEELLVIASLTQTPLPGQTIRNQDQDILKAFHSLSPAMQNLVLAAVRELVNS